MWRRKKRTSKTANNTPEGICHSVALHGKTLSFDSLPPLDCQPGLTGVS